LDFLGFSRQNQDLSMSYEGKSSKIFSYRFFRAVEALGSGPRSRRCGNVELSIAQV
jgi:hypothetical protein